MSVVNSKFILAGNATFTISNSSGEHFTFKVKRAKDKEVYFINVLSGPDNQNDYTYMGLVQPDGTIRRTERSKVAEGAKSFRVALFALRIAWGRQAMPVGYKMQHAGRCCRCGRKLTTPESIERGIGPECAGKV